MPENDKPLPPRYPESGDPEYRGDRAHLEDIDGIDDTARRDGGASPAAPGERVSGAPVRVSEAAETRAGKRGKHAKDGPSDSANESKDGARSSRGATEDGAKDRGDGDDAEQYSVDAGEVREERMPASEAREQLARHEAAPAPDADPKPTSPADVSKRGWVTTLKRTFAEFTDDGCTDLAAALTYHAVMSIFPMLIAIVSLLGVFGEGEATTKAAIDSAADLGVKQGTLDSVEKVLNELQSSSGAGLALAIGILGALWSASNYVNGFSRALNKVYEVQEGRSMIKLRATMLIVTAIILVLVVMVGLSLVMTGPVAQMVGNMVGLGDQAVQIWDWAKWPVIALVVMLIIALLYWATPNVRQPKMRWVSPGSVFAFFVWALASAAFGFYVANFGSYNKTYGALAGVIVFLLWLWLTNTVLLLGAELDAELERSRELEAGLPAEKDLQLPLRGTKTLEKKADKEEKTIADARELRLKNAEALERERA